MLFGPGIVYGAPLWKRLNHSRSLHSPRSSPCPTSSHVTDRDFVSHEDHSNRRAKCGAYWAFRLFAPKKEPAFLHGRRKMVADMALGRDYYAHGRADVHFLRSS